MPGFMTHYILGIKLYQEIPENTLKESIHSHKMDKKYKFL